MSVAVSGAAKLVVAIMAGNADVVVSYNALIDRWNALAAELRVVHRHLRAGRVSRGLQVLVELLDTLDGLSDGESDSGYSNESGESGESAAPADALAATLPAPLPGAATLPENVQQELVAVLTEEPTAAPPAAPQAFTGRSFRLDD